MTDAEKAIENLREYAVRVAEWNFHGDFLKGYQEAMRYVLECLEKK